MQNAFGAIVGGFATAVGLCIGAVGFQILSGATANLGTRGFWIETLISAIGLGLFSGVILRIVARREQRRRDVSV